MLENEQQILDGLKRSIDTMQAALKDGTEDHYTRLEFDYQLAVGTSIKCGGPEKPVYRASILPNDVIYGKIPTERFSYPNPEKFRVGRGRANIEGVPVFYCCATEVGALLEKLLSNTAVGQTVHNDLIFISEWKCPEIETEIFEMKTRFKRGSYLHDHENGGVTIIDDDVCDLQNLYFETFEKCYLSDNGYPFTSKFSNSILYGSNRPFEYNMISYPSVIPMQVLKDSTEQIYNNYAISTSFFDLNYKLTRVMAVQLQTPLKEVLTKGFVDLWVRCVGYPDHVPEGYISWNDKDPLHNRILRQLNISQVLRNAALK